VNDDREAAALAAAANHYVAFLQALGVAWGEAATQDTARRVAELVHQWTRAERESLPALSLIDAPSPQPEWVVVRGVRFHSFCEHHMVPFFGCLDVAFLPERTIVGFGSIVRLLDHLCHRPQLQERLVEEMAEALWVALQPRGLMVRIAARQLCVELRGRGHGIVCTSFGVRGCCATAEGRTLALGLLGPELSEGL